MVKNPSVNEGDTRDVGLTPGLGRSPLVANGNPTPIFLPGESHRQRSLASYSPQGSKESDTTEHTHTHTHTHKRKVSGTDPLMDPLMANSMHIMALLIFKKASGSVVLGSSFQCQFDLFAL